MNIPSGGFLPLRQFRKIRLPMMRNDQHQSDKNEKISTVVIYEPRNEPEVQNKVAAREISSWRARSRPSRSISQIDRDLRAAAESDLTGWRLVPTKRLTGRCDGYLPSERLIRVTTASH